MKISNSKVKRPHVLWYEVLRNKEDLLLERDFWLLKTKHPKMSNNRIAWNVLKKHYSTTALNRVRYLGESL